MKAMGVVCALALVAGACGSDDDASDTGSSSASVADTAVVADTTADTATTDTTDTTDDTADTTDTTADSVADSSVDAAGLLWDNGECDSSLQEYGLGITAPFETPVLSLIDQVTALEVSAEAFNARGGIAGHCIRITTCDEQGDPNVSLDCARQFVADESIVATINDTTAFNPQGWLDLTVPADLARFALSPGTESMAEAATNSYPFTAGGAGTTFVMAPACTSREFTKVGMINVDTPSIDLLIPVLENVLKSHGAEFVGNVPVPAGTTDFQQFVITMEDLGAECVMLPLGENEVLQVLGAADQLDTGLWFSTSSGSTGLAGVRELTNINDQILLNGALPAATGSQERWPALAVLLDDLSASGEPQLQPDTLKESPMRSWVGLYAFIRAIEDFGTPDDVSRAAVNTAIRAAQDIDMLGLTPKWTPNSSVMGSGPFGRVSNPWHFLWTYDPAIDNFVVDDDMVDMISEVTGVIDYPQPE